MNSVSRPYSSRIARLLVALFVPVIGVAACDDDPVTVDPVVWLADLDGAEVTGIASVASTNTTFEASIEIQGAAEDAVFTWEIAGGTCAQPGDRIGAADNYPDLEADAGGGAEAEANVNSGLDEEEDYIAIVRDETGQDPVTVACGALAIDE